MLSDIEAGHVNCVIVKDLSRLGRNTIDTGYYIEQYFRIRSIRFIAVNENFDTANPEDAHSGITIPLRNMINEAYALDIGRKIRAQQRQAMKDGKFIGARTPYGYLKAEDDCHQLIIDPVAAIVVQRMFRWASEGAGLNTIAVRLNEAGILTPSHYKKMQGKITHENLLGSGKWQTRTVGVILRSEVYTGDLVQGQTKTVDHRQVKADAEEWTVVRDIHEAIISREQFAAVQEILNQTASRAKAREVKAFTKNLLKGKVFCAHCGGRPLNVPSCGRRSPAANRKSCGFAVSCGVYMKTSSKAFSPRMNTLTTRRSTKAASPTSPWKWNSWRTACERWMLKQRSTGRWNRMPHRSRPTVR